MYYIKYYLLLLAISTLLYRTPLPFFSLYRSLCWREPSVGGQATSPTTTACLHPAYYYLPPSLSSQTFFQKAEETNKRTSSSS